MVCARTALILAVCLLIAAPALGGEWVEFEDGRVLEVESVALRDGVAVLELDGGGRLSVPAGRIVGRGPLSPSTRSVSDAARVERATADEPWRKIAGTYADLIAEVARKERLDPALLTAVARVESNFDPFAVSEKNACGLLQLLPETAERFGVDDVFDVRQNVEGGARYLRWLIDRYEGDTELALAAYNAGEDAVDRHRGVPPFEETRNYVTLVMEGAGLAPGR